MARTLVERLYRCYIPADDPTVIYDVVAEIARLAAERERYAKIAEVHCHPNNDESFNSAAKLIAAAIRAEPVNERFQPLPHFGKGPG